jgi:hypothetical protein
MTVEWSKPAQRDFRQHLEYLAETDRGLAVREGWRIRAGLEWFAELNVDGLLCEIRGWDRPVRRHYLEPFKVYYERRPGGLFVVRLRHYARLPLDR